MEAESNITAQQRIVEMDFTKVELRIHSQLSKSQKQRLLDYGIGGQLLKPELPKESNT